MITVSDVLSALLKKAPLELAMSFDNPGFLVGSGGDEIKKIIVALDITDKVIDEAISVGANLIVSHHPVIFGERKAVTDSDITGRLLLKMIKNGISAICMHTNLDCARGGVNDILADLFGIENRRPVEPCGEDGEGCGRFGELSEESTLSEFLPRICEILSANGLRYFDAKRPVKKLMVGGGSCGDYVSYAAEFGCDTLITADIKHNQFLDAAELSINAIDAGHFATENIVCPYICDIIKSSFPTIQVDIANSNIDITDYFKANER